MMKIAIIGQSWLASEVINQVAGIDGVEVVAAAPETPGDRFHQVIKAAGMEATAAADLPACDLLLAAHCHTYLGARVRQRFRLGVLAYHPSLLPRHRGRDALHWTIAMGDSIAGGTAFWMDDGMDTGPIESQDFCFVNPADSPMELWKRELGPMGVKLLTEATRRLAQGEPPRRLPQNEAFATYEPPAKAAYSGHKRVSDPRGPKS
jgi:methionyl-tRNA formyltransferase